MSDSKTQPVRTREERISIYPDSVHVGRYAGDTLQVGLDEDDLDPDMLVEGVVSYIRCDIALRNQIEAEYRGYQRRVGEEVAQRPIKKTDGGGDE